MSTPATDGETLMREYFDALSSKPKTVEVIRRFVRDPSLEEHILTVEAAFPQYELVPDAIVADGDLTAVRATFRGVHRGSFMGIEATGAEVSGPVMIFYRLADGYIAEHWLQMDMAGIMKQLTPQTMAIAAD